MQVILTEADIRQAVRNYVAAMGITRPVSTIKFQSFRKGDSAFNAEIELEEDTTSYEAPRIKPAVLKEVEALTESAGADVSNEDDSLEEEEEEASATTSIFK